MRLSKKPQYQLSHYNTTITPLDGKKLQGGGFEPKQHQSGSTTTTSSRGTGEDISRRCV